jgi:hypothetical protein
MPSGSTVETSSASIAVGDPHASVTSRLAARTIGSPDVGNAVDNLIGTTCPGRARSPGEHVDEPNSRIVLARSLAEIPVLIPLAASTDTANVHSDNASVIRGSPSWSARQSGSVTSKNPDVWRTQNATLSAVTRCAA